MKKFTLIELLVVIAIIGILASILMPSLSKARLKAFQTVCLSNQRQVGTAAISYIVDNKEYAPTDSASADASGLQRWYDRLIPGYLPEGRKVVDGPSDVQHCPSGKTELQEWDSTISMNSHINGDVWGDQPPVTKATAAETMLVMDSHETFRSAWTVGFTLFKLAEKTLESRIARHLDKAVVTYLDGHGTSHHYNYLLTKSDGADKFWDPEL